MSFRILKKRTTRTVGTVSAIFFTGFMVYGFISSYINIKNSQIKKIDLTQVPIFADKAAGASVVYEAVLGEQCIKQLTSNTDSSLAVSSVNSISASSMPALVVNHSSQASSKSPTKKPSVLDIQMIQASSPSCVAKMAFPNGYEKLGAFGFVALELNIAKTGRVVGGIIEKSSGFADLDLAALKQITETWKFEPCKKAGEAVVCKQRIRFRWEVK